MKITLSLLSLLMIISCGQDTKSEDQPEQATAPVAETPPPAPLVYPALYSNWEIGKRENMNTVLSLYKAWDESSVDNMKNSFADSIVMDMPAGKRITSSRESITDVLVKYRNAYAQTSNQVLSIYPLVNKETNDEWVSVLLYNKWTYKDNTRDSMLYQDLWKLQNGKINYLLSLEQTPSRTTVKQLEKMSERIKK